MIDLILNTSHNPETSHPRGRYKVSEGFDQVDGMKPTFFVLSYSRTGPLRLGLQTIIALLSDAFATSSAAGKIVN